MLARIGTTPTRPTASRQTLPTAMPAQAIAIGGTAVLGLGRHHEVDRQPDRRAEPPQHPDRVEVVAAGHVQHQASPISAATAPDTVSRRGRCPCRSQSQPTTSRMPRYSSSNATPTDSRATALK